MLCSACSGVVMPSQIRAPAAARDRRSHAGSCPRSWRHTAPGRRRRSAGPGTIPISCVHCATPIESAIGISAPTQPAASSRHTSRMRRAIIAPSRSVVAGSTTQNSSPPVRASMSPGRNRVCAISVKCCRQASPAAWPWVSLIALKPSRSITSSTNGSPLRSDTRAFLGQAPQQMPPVGDAGEIVQQRQIGDLVAQPVDRHQQETEIPRHRQEQQHQHQHRLHRTGTDKGEVAADVQQAAAGAEHVQRDHDDGDDAGKPGAGIDRGHPAATATASASAPAAPTGPNE